MNLGLGHPLGPPITTSHIRHNPMPLLRRYYQAALLNDEPKMRAILKEAAAASLHIHPEQHLICPRSSHLIRTLQLEHIKWWYCPHCRERTLSPACCHGSILREILDAAEAVQADARQIAIVRRQRALAARL